MSTHIAVLPKDVQSTLSQPSTSLCPLRLPHPRTGLTALFVPHGKSLLELHAISPDASRSWFVGQSVVSGRSTTKQYLAITNGLIDGKLLLMTPIDPAFVLIPFLRALLATEPKTPFKPTDDLIEELVASYSPPEVDQADVTTFMALDGVRQALKQLCETKDIPPDITVQRPSNESIIGFLKRRIDRVAAAQRYPDEPDQNEAEPDLTKPGPAYPTLYRQHLRLGLAVSELGPLDDPKAQSIRTATCIKLASEVVGTWVEDGLLGEVLATYDISAYTAHADMHAEQARAEQAAAIARAEAAEAGKGKKGKGTGEKRKAGPQASRGVDKLKKANTKGMSTLNTFFAKKP